ncbi:ABC transporter permease subunit [Nibribacter koreensis]|uniref:ABC transporter permease subunit n=1 Tax=Nibribacter koreensis TaxID=1084519 RepID=UPI0031EA04B7
MSLTASALPARLMTYQWKVMLAAVWLATFTLLAFLPLPENALNAIPENALLPPFQDPFHWLGTDQLGREINWYLVAATQTAWWLTFPPLLGATLIGIIIGTTSAHFAKKPLKLPLLTLALIVLALLWAIYLIYLYLGWVIAAPRAMASFWALTFGSLLLLVIASYGITRITSITKRSLVTLPVDEAAQRLMDFWTTFPKLLLLLLLSTLSSPSVMSMGVWIMVTYWVLPARLARNRSLLVRNELFFEAAIALGLPHPALLIRHLWPSMKGQLITNFCFNASGLLGIGSTLAFLGIGLPADVPTWGKMLSLARFSLESWWLLLFPATLLLLSIISLQAVGNYLSKRNI